MDSSKFSTNGGCRPKTYPATNNQNELTGHDQGKDVPLDKKLDVGQENGGKKLLVLRPGKVQERSFCYYTPPNFFGDEKLTERWMEVALLLEHDLHWLLKQPHDLFWVQTIYDTSLQESLDSFLKDCPRTYDVLPDLDIEVLRVQKSLERLYFFVFLRMSTHKESSESFITASVYGNMLYENYLFDIPKIIDLCCIYGHSNKKILHKMINNIFMQQPKYNNDLLVTIQMIAMIFDSILKKCGVSSEDANDVQLLSQKMGFSALNEMPVAEVQDTVRYFHDAAKSVLALLEVFPQAVFVFVQSDFVMRVIIWYESLNVAFSDALEAYDWKREEDVRGVVMNMLNQGLYSLIKIFHIYVVHKFSDPLQACRNQEEAMPIVEEFMEIMSSALNERRFLSHLQHFHPFSEDLKLLKSSPYQVDETRIKFIWCAIKDAESVHSLLPRENEVAVYDSVDFVDEKCHVEQALPESLEASDGGKVVNGVELVSLISSVKDLLPDLGEGFIEACLKEKNYELEKVVSMLLDGQLTPSLELLDQKMECVLPKENAVPDVLETRANIFDYDQFDVFNQDEQNIAVSSIFSGKREQVNDIDSLLKDKTYVTPSVEQLYNKYGTEDVETMYLERGEYEDEYDDTYDVSAAGADDDDEPETFLTRPLNKHVSHRWKKSNMQDEEECDDVDRKEFVQDPAKLREQAAARRASRMPERAAREVVGKAKGQGQSAEVLRNRKFKEKRKGTHNKKMADKKMELK